MKKNKYAPWLKVALATIVLLLLFYMIGPRYAEPYLKKDFPAVPAKISNIESYVAQKESEFTVKPDNESRILWGDAPGKRTEYVLLYLHGFSASYYEGYPVNYDFVKQFGVNAYLPRLAEHGLVDDEPLLKMHPERLYESAREALAIAHILGEKVIIMSTSTGGTLSLMLAADFPDKVDGLILYSPNIRIKNKLAPLLSASWGLQIARLNFGGKYRYTKDSEDSKMCQYWNCKYRLESTVYLQQLLDSRMYKEEFSKVHTPVFLGYYYKDKKHQDQTVDVGAALEMFDALSTPDSLKMKRAFPDAGAHVIASELTSESVKEVEEATFDFAEKVLKMKPKNIEKRGLINADKK